MATVRRRVQIVILLLAVGVAAAVGLLLYVAVGRSPRGDRDGEPAPEAGAEAPRRPARMRRWAGLRPAGSAAGDGLEAGEPGTGKGGRRHGPSRPPALRNRPIAAGEIPLVPPRFADPSERARFRRWWVKEFQRRMEIYQRLEADRRYPAASETESLLERYYDAVEPRGPGESVEDALDRRRQWRTLWKQFLDTYGATPKTVASRGGDPQYGAATEPPVTPPGVPASRPPAAEPAKDVPPGVGRDYPPGEEPPHVRPGPME